MSAPKTLHRVTFEVEDGCVSIQRVQCLSEHAAWCLVGCPEPTCDDWSHGDDGCWHCQETCDCECSAHAREHECARAKVTECSCSERDAHGRGDECPHTFAILPSCWLLPWLEYDHYWFTEADDVLDLIRDRITAGRDEHPAEVWSVDMTGMDGEGNDFWYAVDPDPDSLRYITAQGDCFV